MNWLGLAFGLLILGFICYGWSKRNQKKGKGPWQFIFQGFGIVSVAREIPRFDGRPAKQVTEATARVVANQLVTTYRETWAECRRIYKHGKLNWPVERVAVVGGMVEPDHPEVVWPAPVPMIKIRLQDDMNFWFAGEIHNVFRYTLYGINHIYKPVNQNDEASMKLVKEWIRLRYLPWRQP